MQAPSVNGGSGLRGTNCGRTTRNARWEPPDRCRLLQLALATVWLLDGALQFQNFMFTPGANGFSGMLGSTAAGNPHLIAQSITWNASIVDHHAVATDATFALIQVLIGLGIAWRPSVRITLGASIAWSLAVWWFGEGLGGVLHGAGTPIGGGPGAVLFYALLAVLLWPTDTAHPDAPFVAARAVGATAARVMWAVVWIVMASLALIGAGRAPQGVRNVIDSVNPGEPGWLGTIDHHVESLVAQQGLVVALVFVLICLLVALGPFLPAPAARGTLVLAIVTAVVIWVVGENFGMILAGGATDPNSGPLLILLAIAYWPARRRVPDDSSVSRPAAVKIPMEAA
jgi:hypothetical protein